MQTATNSQPSKVDAFLAQMKAKCEAKAIDFAKLELSVWDDNHESQLIQHFGYTKKTVAKRKRELTSTANG